MRGLEYLDDDGATRGRKKISNKPPSKKSDHKHEYVVTQELFWDFNKDMMHVYYECSVCKKVKHELKTLT
jgi:hypothetical protein